MTRPTAELEFTRGPGGRTVLARSRVRAPLAFTRAFDAGDRAGTAEAWLQSTSGGLLSGDDVAIRVSAESGASAAVAPQSATVVFGASGSCTGGGGDRRGPTAARLGLELVAAGGAHLVWVPRPTVLLPGADLCTSVVVGAEPGSSVLVADAFVQHRPTTSGVRPASGGTRAAAGNGGRTDVGDTEASAEREFGSLDASVTVEIGGRLVAADRQRTMGTWPVAAHGFVWAVGWQRDGSDALERELLRAGLAAGALPNGAGIGVRAAGDARGVGDAVMAAIAIFRARCRIGARAGGLTS